MHDPLDDATHGHPPRDRRLEVRRRISPGAIHALLRAESPSELFARLADVAAAATGADAVVIVEVRGDAEDLEARGVHGDLAAWHGQHGEMDPKLGEHLLAFMDARFHHARTLPLSWDGGDFGALVLFFREAPTGDGALSMAQTLADIASAELQKRLEHTELCASRAVLQQTEGLRALGEMSAGIAHDLLNLLNPLKLHLELLRRTVANGGSCPPGVAEAVAEMGAVLGRGVETVSRLRDFGRQTPEAPVEVVDLDALAREAIGLCHARIASKRRAHGIRVVLESGAPDGVRARASDLMAAILNLLSNALDALDDGGLITVTTGERDDGAWIRVADDGPGIPGELHHRVFEPFFTTKGDGGTGLGLPMVYACVRRYGGRLTLDSAPGCGTRFTLCFPRASNGRSGDAASTSGGRGDTVAPPSLTFGARAACET